MASLLSARTTAGHGTGASVSGPCTVFVRGTFDGAICTVEVSDDDTTYVAPDNLSPHPGSELRAPGCCNVDGRGAYYVRCSVVNVGSSTSISAVSTQ